MTPPGIWTGQLGHIAALAVLLALSQGVWRALGAAFPAAFWCAMAVPVLHQVYVWLAWRLELRSRATSATLGFPVYVGVFFLLFAARFVSIGVLAWLDRGSLDASPSSRGIVATLLALPALYTAHSVRRYFGLIRAAGADHFDARYRHMPLVREGIFRLNGNAMYTFAFLAFWSIAVAFGSASALVVAAFAHAYIWVHYFATESPDMKYLHGETDP